MICDLCRAVMSAEDIRKFDFTGFLGCEISKIRPKTLDEIERDLLTQYYTQDHFTTLRSCKE